MSKILIFLLIVTAMPLHANDYVQSKGQCVITADVQDFFNPATMLPFSLKLEYTLAYLKDTGELVATKFETSTESHNTTPAWAEEVVEQIEDNISVASTYGEETVFTFKPTRDQLNALLHYLGSYRSRHVQGGFNEIDYNVDADGSARVQVHTDTNYGLSFHIYTNCTTSQTPPSNGDDDQDVPGDDDDQRVPTKYECSYHLESVRGRLLDVYTVQSARIEWACNSAKNKCFDAARQMAGRQYCRKAQ